MNKQTLYIPGRMPGMNDFLDLAKRQGRARSSRGKVWNSYNKLKNHWMEVIHWECVKQGIQPVEKASFEFLWVERNRRRDKDNIAGGGRKLILDGLVCAGILPNDGWKQVEGWEDRFTVGRPGVEVCIVEGD